MPEPKTILFVHHSNELYGADIVLLQTIRGLDRSLFSPIVLLPEDVRDGDGLVKEGGGLSAELEKAGVPITFLPLAVLRRRYFKPKNFPGYMRELAGSILSIRKIIREKNVSLVHSNTMAVWSGAFAARVAGVKHVWHVHEITVNPRAMRKLLHFLAPRLSCVVVCCSDAVRKHLLVDQPRFASKPDHRLATMASCWRTLCRRTRGRRSGKSLACRRAHLLSG